MEIEQKIIKLGLNKKQAEQVIYFLKTLPPTECWKKLSTEILNPSQEFELHKLLYDLTYPNWEKQPEPAWFPLKEFATTTNLAKCMQKLNFKDYQEFHTWSYKNYSEFWRFVVEELKIKFDKPYEKIADISAGIEKIKWFTNAKLNIVKSCFNTKQSATAIIYQAENGAIKKLTYVELLQLSNRIANSLVKLNFNPGDPIAIDMPMTAECVAIYLGIIKAGCVAVSIADSFTAEEIAMRLRITQAKAIFTQDGILRGGKYLPLYTRVIAANAPMTIVLPCQQQLAETLRQGDVSWQEFLVANDEFNDVSCDPLVPINVLFSSGTTGDPKAIPWNHTTAIKCASDAYFHHNIQAGDILAWPTNLGWMMGPWLIFAALINHGTLALYGGAPRGRDFGEFVQNNKVTMLGVVPTLVKAWRSTACMQDLDWSAIKLFSSTAECSNIDDMLYLMSLANYKPIIEYCGGTEIGGGYITGTLIQPAAPAAFTTAAMGLNFHIIDGEIAIVPPSLGLSLELLNKDHHQVYFADMPKSTTGELLRRHGDEIQPFANGFYRAHGRVDDTMKLSGIKVSSAEIERIVMQLSAVSEAAAIAVPPIGGGPTELVIYVVPNLENKLPLDKLKLEIQTIIKEHLNPLFKLYDVVYMDTLPRTASNKIMRRVLRDQYQQQRSS